MKRQNHLLSSSLMRLLLMRKLSLFCAIITVWVAGYGSRAMAYVSYGPVSLWDTSYSDTNGWNGHSSYWQTIQYADLNGDKKADVCGRGGNGLVCALSTGSGFGAPSLWTSNYSDAFGWNSSSAYWQTIQYADLNGDKKADVCGRGGDGILCALSTGSGFGTPSLWTSNYSDAFGWNSSSAYWQTIQYADLDGDKMADVCGRGGDGILCAYSQGTSFGTVWLKFSDYSDANGWATAPSYWQTIQYADLNGDGVADVCGRGGAGLWCSASKIVIIH